MLIQSKSTVLAIANATALASGVVLELSGTEVASTLNGSPLSRQALNSLIGSRVHANFSKYTQTEVK